MSINDRIKGLRLQKSITQQEFAKQIGVSVVSVQCWERGTKNPSMTAIILMAEYFNVTTDYLLGVTNRPSDALPLSLAEQKLLESYRNLDSFGRKMVDTVCSLEQSRIIAEKQSHDNEIAQIAVKESPCRYIPRYSTPSAAGSSVPLDGDDFEMILVDNNTPYDADFAVGIQGNSMMPYIHDGDTVYVKRNCEIDIGDVGIFCVDGAMYWKQYYVDMEGNLTLVSANPRLKHTNVYVSADSGSSVTCYGKVLLEKKIKLPSYFTR